MCCVSLPSEVRQLTIINEFKATLISIVIFLNSSKAIFSFTHGLRLPYEAGFFLYHLQKPCFTDTHLIQTPHYYEALPGGGGGLKSPVWILKHLVSAFINACRLLSALPWLSQFGGGRLSLVATFWAMSLVGIYPGSASIMASLLCPWEKKALTFSLNLTRLIWTLSVALYVFILTGFDCILVFIKVFS